MRSSQRRRYVVGFRALVSLALVGAGTVAAVAGPAVAEDRAADHAGNAVLTGVPGRTVDGLEDAGAVELRTRSGDKTLLTARQPQAGARFGTVVHETMGLWSENHFTFIGAPGLTVDGKPNAGGIYMYSREEGDDIEFLGVLTQADPGVPGEARAGARFGASIDSYQFDVEEPPYGDYKDTDTVRLFAGAPGLDVGGAEQAGGVVDLRLRPAEAGLEVVAQQLHTLASSDTGVEPTSGDQLGTTLAVWAGWNGTRQVWESHAFAGAPTATVDGKPNAGFVLHTDDKAADQLFYPGTKGLPGVPQAGERFGSALSYAAEQLPDQLLRTHLAIGAPGKQVRGKPNAGKVYTLQRDTDSLGSDSGAPWEGGPGFSQESPNNGAGSPVSGVAEAGDQFGTAVHYPHKHLRHKLPALFVGAPGEDIGEISNAGAVYGLYGVPGTHEGKAGGVPGTDHRFGAAISTNARDHDHGPILTKVDYIVGIPGAGDGAGAVVHGSTWLWSDNPVNWKGRWTLFTGDREAGDAYGSTFDQGAISS